MDNRPQVISRRSFMKIGGMSVAVLFAARPFGRLAAQADVLRPRRLVVLEQNGGNDGLNTVIPYGDGAYYDARKDLAISPDRVLHLDSQWGLHYSLANMNKRYMSGKAAIMLGVGHSDPDLSHFRMMDIWRSGNPGGGSATSGTGWAGRLLGQLALGPAPIAAVSLATSVSPIIIGPTNKSVAVPSQDAASLNFPDGLDQLFRSAINGMSQLDEGLSSPAAAARSGLKASLSLSDFVTNLIPSTYAYPDTGTGQSLALAATLMKANDWIRVVHIPLPLDHDTHIAQLPRQEANLAELDMAVEAFLSDMEQSGMLGEVLLATTSEFGRRVEPNGSGGTDHGTASFHFIMGSRVRGGLYGNPPSLTHLDQDGNLISGLSFLDHLATLSSWMGVDPSQILPGGNPQNVFN